MDVFLGIAGDDVDDDNVEGDEDVSGHFYDYPAPKFSVVSELLKNDIQQLSDDLVETRRHKPPKIVDGHLILDEIGFGAYARVKECLHLATLQRRAVKIIKMEKIRKIRDAVEDINREVRLLRRFKHKNVIRMYEHFWHQAKGKLYLFVELCASSLQQLLDRAPEKRLGRLTSRFYFAQLLDGLEYLHSQNVAHKDIKAGNLLLTVDHLVKMVDFGVSDELDPYDTNHFCSNSRGTPKFQPPEIASGQREFDGFKVDVWCSGVTLFNMLSGLYPYEGSTIFIIYDRIINQKLVLPDCIKDSDARCLLQEMLQKDARDRCSIADIRRHPWLRGGTAAAADDLARRANHRRSATIINASCKECPKTSDLPSDDDASVIDHLIDLTINRIDQLYEHLENLAENESILYDQPNVKGQHSNGHHSMIGGHGQLTFDLYPKGNQSYPCMTSRNQVDLDLPRTSVSAEGIAEPQPEVKGQDRGLQRPSNHFSLSNLRNFRIRLKKSGKWPKMECKMQ